MAALQQSPVAFHPKSPPAARIRAKSLYQIPLRSSFSGNIRHLRLAGKSGLKLRPARHGGAAGSKMMDSASSSYASALADVAKSNGTLDATSADLEKVEKIFSEPQIFDFFVNPIIAVEKKREVIDDIASSSKLQPHVANFLNILIDMRRIDLINEIVKEFEIFYNKMTDTEMAVVSSVVKLDSQHLAQIAQGVQKLTGAKNVRIKTVINPSLVAGFTIRYGSSGSKLIDMSVKKQLDEIATQLDFSDIVGSLAT
ncbi:ATP synthase delta chain, chloroplastic [Magnolia sinica]|uniref:ATP synthase delta chain, chloroplastic n=1 Tax=Magnolia sinica TaxID=86752 RepID=UPI00265AB9D2|nr:ATP synthase delta chain, chloroplastic [Magnolia sinica]